MRIVAGAALLVVEQIAIVKIMGIDSILAIREQRTRALELVTLIT